MEKINYNKLFNETVSQLKNKPALLLHVCCAPCLSGVIGRVENFFDITIYYYNPNIKPESEYEKRLHEIKKYIKRSGRNIPIVCGEYDEAVYAGAVSGCEKREGGERCRACCTFRLDDVAKYAAKHGFAYFCTTLTVSPHKNAVEINAAMKESGRKYGIKPLLSDFKKDGGFLKTSEECKKYGIYRQDYCGCAPRKLKIYVTGGIASGKSEFTGILRALGAYTISADEVSRALTAEGMPLNEELKNRFSAASVSGKLDRAALKTIVFNDEKALAELNKITHGAIRREIVRQANETDAKIVVVEVPLLFESGWNDADITLTVSADESLRRKRAEMRDGISGELFTAIAAKQLTDKEREALADITVYNSGDRDELKKRAEELYTDWQKSV